MNTDANATDVINSMEKKIWNMSLMEFSDGSLYQTTAYGDVFWKESNCKRIAVKKKDDLMAMALVRRLPVPLVQLYYLRWGPVWRRGDKHDIESFGIAIDRLVTCCARKPTQSIRIVPAVYDHEEWAPDVIKCLESKGFKRASDKIDAAYHTIFLPLDRSLEEIRKGADRRWRQQLNKAEKYEFTVTIGNGPDVVEKMMSIYREMLTRKKLTLFIEIERFVELQSLLPEPEKLQIVLAEFEGKPVAFTMVSVCGDNAVVLFAGTAGDALRTNASYFTWWKTIEYLVNDRKVRMLDLCGVDKKRNPGGYQFKSKLAGKTGFVVSSIGTFEKHGGIVSYLFLKELSLLRQARILSFRVMGSINAKLRKKKPTLK